MQPWFLLTQLQEVHWEGWSSSGHSQPAFRMHLACRGDSEQAAKVEKLVTSYLEEGGTELIKPKHVQKEEAVA